MTEETGEAERVKAVLTERLRTARVLVQQLAKPLRAAQRGRLEDVELRIACEQLVDAGPIASVNRLQQVGHQRSNLDRRRSFNTRPPVWHSGQ